MKENSKYYIYAKISPNGLYTADSIMERQLDTINSVKSSIEIKGYTFVSWCQKCVSWKSMFQSVDTKVVKYLALGKLFSFYLYFR